MKQHKITQNISILCCIAGLFISAYGLIFGIGSINASGWDRYNTVYIPYSIAAFLIITFDLLIAVHVIKNGFLFSCISSILKIAYIIGCLPAIVIEYADGLEYGSSIFDIEVRTLISLVIMSIPSIINVFSKWHSFENRCLERSSVSPTKQPKVLKVLSIICGIIAQFLSVSLLVSAVDSVHADRFGRLGVLFMIPALFAIFIIVFDFLISVNVIKIGFLYSLASSILKIGIAVCLIPYSIPLVTFLTIAAIPSVINIFSRWRVFKNSICKKGTSL